MFTRTTPVHAINPPLVILENLYVAAPCPAPWSQMAGDDRVRYCTECKLNVYNISEMTRSEAEELIRAHEGRLCVRFFRRADGTILTKNCPRGLRTLVRRVSRIAGAVLTAAMSVASAFSQTPPKDTQQTQQSQGNTGMELTVVDPSGALIPNADILLCRCKDRARVDVRTDSAGVAHISGLSKGKYSLEIKAAGFKSRRQDVKIQPQKTEHLLVKLQVAPANVVVEVTAAPMEIQGAAMGMIGETQEPFPWPTTGVNGRPSPLQ